MYLVEGLYYYVLLRGPDFIWANTLKREKTSTCTGLSSEQYY